MLKFIAASYLVSKIIAAFSPHNLTINVHCEKLMLLDGLAVSLGRALMRI